MNKIFIARKTPPHKPAKKSITDRQEYLFFLDRTIHILTHVFGNEPIIEDVEYTKGQTIAFAEYYESFTGSWNVNKYLEHVWPGTWGYD